MVSRQLSGRWTGATAGAVGVIAAAVVFASPAQAATAPSDSAPSCWFQTNGPHVAAAKGDWYTSTLNQGPDRNHLFQLTVPAAAALPVTLRVIDAESNRGSNENHDEVLNRLDPTRFTLRRDGFVLAWQAFPEGSPRGSVFEVTIVEPGTYFLLSETGAFPIAGDDLSELNDDQNSFRIHVLPDGTGTLDPVDDVRIEFVRATIACTEDESLGLTYSVPEGTTMTTLRNFDLDANGSLTYVPPTGMPIVGTKSLDAEWKQDMVPVGANDERPWTIILHGLKARNQVVFEASADGVQLPLSVNRPPAWQDLGIVTRSEPIDVEPVPVTRGIPLVLDDPDDGQRLSLSVPDGGHCAAEPTHPFTSVAFASGSVVAGAGPETAELRIAVGAHDVGTHCVRARVRDGVSARDLELMVEITAANSTPIADAGPDQAIDEPGATVTLNGAGSKDPDGDPLMLTWTRTSGSAVAPASSGDPLSFGPVTTGIYEFELIASDGSLSDRDQLRVTVGDGAPIVTASRNRTVPARRRVLFRLGSFADPGLDGPWQMRVTWGDRSKAMTRTYETAGPLGSARHKFRRGGRFWVTVTVTDDDDAAGVGRFLVRVKRPCVVPSVKGKTLKGARRALKRRNCALGRVGRVFSSRVPAGRIVSQKPGPTKIRPTGARVKVKVSRGPRR